MVATTNMTTTVSDSDALKSLESKMSGDIANNQLYEALQFVQSFIARKKTKLTPDLISKLIFKGTELLSLAPGSSNYAGILLNWFIDGGAGDKVSFQLTSVEGYNDCERLSAVLSKLNSKDSEKVIDPIYRYLQPLLNTTIKSSETSDSDKLSMKKLAMQFVDAFMAGGNWFAGFTFAISIEDYKTACKVCDLWAGQGYVTEGVLFFARACLYTMGENGASQGIHFLSEASRQKMIDKHMATATAATAATWHVCEMIAELYTLKDVSTTEKRKIFAFLSDKYKPIFVSVDSRFSLIFDKAGEKLFKSVARSANPDFNPMGMLEAMMGGGGMGGMDMASMMQQMSKGKR